MKTRSKQMKALDTLIDAIYRARCSGIQIDVMDISKVFAEGRRAALAGENIEAAVVAFVETIRKN